ncbi:MAG: protein translocase subunit SecD [Endomicrobium sp.]|jgi:protein-export membrane protein SecD|nr:protein translocase subunit SecD [Endomicrobium sp.]
MSRINWKLWVTVALFVFSIWALCPSINWFLMSADRRVHAEKEKDPILGKVIKLGLDLKGGTHLLLEVDSSQLDVNVKTKDVIDRAIEIMRNRIDQFGVVEPLITRQGDKWIVVQLPGIKDPQSAKNLIGKTALLEFRIINNSQEANKVLDLIRNKGITSDQYRKNSFAYPDIQAAMPQGASVFENKEDSKYYILDKTVLTGAFLTNAKVEFEGRFSQPVVSMEFNRKGARIFEDVTERNIQRNLAIVLDGVVQSVPVINQKISGGKAVIQGNFSVEDAKLLATVLRAGALPAPVKVVEERTVGPTLGDDSIRSGFMSALIGIVVIFIFMVIYYHTSGLIADMALTLNLIIILAIMAYFQFTITLPGVAGIALTIAMAVDANVLILERIREELAAGKTARAAVDVGYQKVFWTIVDANITTLIAAVFLFQFGTGSIKGFAVTLSVGLIVSMFTSISVTKAIYDFLFKENLLLKLKM